MKLLASLALLCLLPLAAQNPPQSTPPPDQPAMTAPATPQEPSANPAIPVNPAPPVAATPAPPAANPAAHTSLTSDIMERLTSDPVLGSATITVQVTDDGSVYLNGVVPNQSLADQAVSAVRSVPGVSKVTSQITVSEDPFAPANASRPASAAPAQPAEPAAATDPQAKVAQALSADPNLARVSAHIYGKSVAVIGTVLNSKDETRALQIVQQTLPDYTLQNFLWINPRPAAPPPLIPQQ